MAENVALAEKKQQSLSQIICRAL